MESNLTKLSVVYTLSTTIPFWGRDLVVTYLSFAILTYVAYYQVYIVPINERVWFREDAHILLWIAGMAFGGPWLLAFCVACYILVYSVERVSKGYKYRPLNLLLLVNQSFMVCVTYLVMTSQFPAQRPLEILLTMFCTFILTQLMTVTVTAFLYHFDLRTPGWKRELLKYNLMDSIYLSLYVIFTEHLHDLESNWWLAEATHWTILFAIIGLYYWRTVGIRQTHKVKQQVSELQMLNTQINLANQQVLLAFASSLEKRDPYTAGHSERVAQYAVAIAEELGLPQEDCDLIQLGGLLHDIGKIGIPDYVLNKPGKLTAEEYDIMKQHPVIGEELLRRVYEHSVLLSKTERERMLEIVLYHHERPDGRGYPHGLCDEEIPLFAKLTAVADAFDAMTSNRAYRQAMSPERASQILLDGSGSQFAPQAVDAFLRALDKQRDEWFRLEAAPAEE